MEIRPFHGWRYVGGLDGDVSAYIAPPYDILSAADKEELLARGERNVVAVDLPHVPAKELGPDESYQAAAATLEQWKTLGLIRRDSPPAIYLYEQAFSWAGRAYKRRAMIAGVRATELGKDIIPHERIFPGPLADRLKLTQCTRMQLSPIFGFYQDPSGQVGEILAEATAGWPAIRGSLRGVSERLWLIRDEAKLSAIASALRDVPIFIADGHHRYTTALNYRHWLAGGGELPSDHEANFVMFALVARDDPGLLILPTHRMFSNLDDSGSVEQLAAQSPEFSWRRCGTGDIGPRGIEALLGRARPGAMAFISGRSTTLWIVELADPEAMRQVAADQTDVWRRLPPAVLHKLIIDKALRPWVREGTHVDYTADIGGVLEACRTGQAQLGVVLPGIPVGDVEAVARGGGSMPHKSTYFYPKITTGMVLKPLE